MSFPAVTQDISTRESVTVYGTPVHRYVLILFVQRNIPVTFGDLRNQPGEKPFILNQLPGVRGHAPCEAERIKSIRSEKSQWEREPIWSSCPTHLFLVPWAKIALILKSV